VFVLHFIKLLLWKVLEFYCSEFQALESPGKGIGPGSPGIVNQQFWNC